MNYRENVLTKQQRIAENARNLPHVSFTSLAYHMDVNWMWEAYNQTRKSGAVGIDRQTGEEYGKDLGRNLKDLIDRVKQGVYRAPAVRRVYIPKGNGKERPIGIPTFEDKVLQRGVKMLIEPIYEQEFHDFSFGFRPGRSAHQALDLVWKSIMNMKGCWVIDLDIEKFFDTLDHGMMRKILAKRVRDGILNRLVGKWLKAGIMEGKQVRYERAGTPQGGVISPLLSNIYLHEVLDEWFTKEVKPALKGKSFMVRYADDVILGFEHKTEAAKVLEALKERLSSYSLRINEEKTKLVFFKEPYDSGKGNKPESFNFLGFTHYWGRSRKGNWIVRLSTEKSRFARGLKNINKWCRRNRHIPLSEQHRMLSLILKGHYSYYGVTNNYHRISAFRFEVEKLWKKWLSQRCWKGFLSWVRFCKILRRFQLPKPRIVHSCYAVKV